MRGKFRFKDDYVYKMPVHFGGYLFYPIRTTHGDMTSIVVKFETDEETLLNYLPEDFELLEPIVSIQYVNFRDVEWMANGDYRLIQVSLSVRYLVNSEGLEGLYPLVIWENKTCPIIGGREEDGMPKIFADVAMERHYHDHWFTAASYESQTFLRMDLEITGELDQSTIAEMNKKPLTNNFGWRYMPNLGKGGPSLSHATLYPQEARFKQIWKGTGSVEWTVLTQQQHPLQYGIISALAGLPVLKYTDAMMTKGSAQLNVGDSRILP